MPHYELNGREVPSTRHKTRTPDILEKIEARQKLTPQERAIAMETKRTHNLKYFDNRLRGAIEVADELGDPCSLDHSKSSETAPAALSASGTST